MVLVAPIHSHSSSTVSYTHLDGKGTLYIGSAKGLFLYKKGNLEQILLDKNALSASNVVTGLSLDVYKRQVKLLLQVFSPAFFYFYVHKSLAVTYE